MSRGNCNCGFFGKRYKLNHSIKLGGELVAAAQDKVESQGTSQQTANDSSEPQPKRIFVPSLAIVSFVVSIPGLILTILIVDMAAAFNVPVGVAAQLSTVNSIAQVVFALLMGAFAVRFRHKSLLLIGTFLVILSAVFSFFAPTFGLIQFAYIFAGGGAVMVNIMSMTLIGEFLPSHKKAKAISYLFAIIFMASLVGTPLIGFLTNISGWRSVYLLLILPFSIVGVAMSFLGLPSGFAQRQELADRGRYLKSFKQVFSNRSAAACLIGGIIGTAGAGSFGIFALAFYRQHFLASRDFTVAVMFLVSVLFIISALIIGRLVNRFGAKNLSVASFLLVAGFIVAFFVAPNLYVALALNVCHALLYAGNTTAFHCLILDQVPQSRGTMLSLNTVCGCIGSAIGVAVGGALLLVSSYMAVGIAFGVLSIAAAAINGFLTSDPGRK
jgi:predicted MFS family arabinose efflux permease